MNLLEIDVNKYLVENENKQRAGSSLTQLELIKRTIKAYTKSNHYVINDSKQNKLSCTSLIITFTAGT